LSKLTDSIAAMALFGKPKQLEEGPENLPKIHLSQAIKTALGESQGVGNLLTQSLTLIPSNQVEELISILESVIQEYRRLSNESIELEESSPKA
jgi:hypothetical protein